MKMSRKLFSAKLKKKNRFPFSMTQNPWLKCSFPTSLPTKAWGKSSTMRKPLGKFSPKILKALPNSKPNTKSKAWLSKKKRWVAPKLNLDRKPRWKIKKMWVFWRLKGDTNGCWKPLALTSDWLVYIFGCRKGIEITWKIFRKQGRTS